MKLYLPVFKKSAFKKSVFPECIIIDITKKDTIADLKEQVYERMRYKPCDQIIITKRGEIIKDMNASAFEACDHGISLHWVRPGLFTSNVLPAFDDIIIRTETKDLPTVMIDVIESCLEMQELNVPYKLQLISLRNAIVNVLFLNQAAKLSSMNFMQKVSMQMKSDVFCKWLNEVVKIPLLPKQANQDCSKVIKLIDKSLKQYMKECSKVVNRSCRVYPLINCVVNIHKRSGREMVVIVKLSHLDTIQTLKRIIWQEKGIICEKQQLAKGKNILKDDKPIVHYIGASYYSKQPISCKNTINLSLSEGCFSPIKQIKEFKKPIERGKCMVM